LNKCFEGIMKLKFEASTDIIHGMYSAMGEYIDFDKPIDPWTTASAATENRKAKRLAEDMPREVKPIEVWLGEVEEMMRTSLRTSIAQGILSRDKMKKQDWIFAYPQQTILALDQIFWTRDVEAAIKKQTKEALAKAFKQEEAKLQELVTLI